jgi:hypothetical protein
VWFLLKGIFNMSNKNDIKDIRDICNTFLEDWDRQQWMQDHGEWASENWNEARETYTGAINNLKNEREVLVDELNNVSDAETTDRHSLHYVRSALKGFEEALVLAESAAKDLDDQVLPNEQDYIAEGLIDPDDVEDKAQDLGIGERWQGWDCIEGWNAYRAEDALIICWWRNACGNRHDRKLWVVVDEEFFS